MAETKRTLADVVKDIKEKAKELESAAMAVEAQAADEAFTEGDEELYGFVGAVEQAGDQAADLGSLAWEYEELKEENDE